MPFRSVPGNVEDAAMQIGMKLSSSDEFANSRTFLSLSRQNEASNRRWEKYNQLMEFSSIEPDSIAEDDMLTCA